MGGLITVHAALAEPNLFKSIVLMGPLIKPDPNVATPVKKMLSKVLSGVLPSVAIGGLDETGITRDESVVKRIQDDPLNWHGGMRLGMGNALLKAMEALEKDKCLEKITAPLLSFQGGQDKIVSPEGVEFLHDNIGSVEKKKLIYDDAYHNLYCELEDIKSTVIKETCTWIEQYS